MTKASVYRVSGTKISERVDFEIDPKQKDGPKVLTSDSSKEESM
jgi:hypothetical protein